MVTKDDVLKLALEALMRSRKSVSGDLDMAGCAYGRNDPDGHRYDDAKKALETLKQAITAIKEALAEPAQEPEPDELTIAYMSGLLDGKKKRPWVSLTDDQIKEIVGPYGDAPIKGYTRKLFDQIEAALRSKNI